MWFGYSESEDDVDLILDLNGILPLIEYDGSGMNILL